ncbi:ORF6N domain-containing protein [Sulfurimonas crateris]|uniref:ORF6N domain-containing protein n=1 Tax=Sulfurimonas crateris TaxID=2574727 RepID=A0A4U2Z8K8_9BACT|nr:ORF6N domain-containing protein [Sulfurimonas crateris]TKI69301.1 ORF6N domain-containing protein [Sulfurimonas crateris]
MNEPVIEIEKKIFTIRGVQVMVDRDLAELYGVEPKRLGEQVKRNIERFPKEFRFQLTIEEKNELVANCDRFQSLKHSSSLPFAFTEQGVSMLSAVLRSDTAIQTSIQIINSFVKMRSFLSQNADIFTRLELVEKRQMAHEIKIDEKFEKLFDALEDKSIKHKQGILFDGQIYDAYVFVNDLLRSAKSEVLLIDNYIDDTVFTLFSKYQHIKIKIYTGSISKKLHLDFKKYNSQYQNIELQEFKKAHDRFLIIDNTEIYHIGASLKDLGKKWFAFSKFESGALEILERLNNG